MSAKKHLYKSAVSFEINDVPSLIDGNAMPRRDPPQIIPFPTFDAELSDSPNEEDTATQEIGKWIVRRLSPPTVNNKPAQELDASTQPVSNNELFRINEENDTVMAAPKRRVKKAGRVVPSRYKSAASSFKRPAASSHHTAGDISKHHTDKQPLLPKPVHNMSVNRPSRPLIGATSTPVVSFNKPHGGFDQSFPCIDMSSISGKNFIKAKPLVKKMNRTRYLEHRLLQAAFLDVLSSKTLQEQEKSAQKQLCSLWKAVEDVKKENGELERAIASEEMKIVVDKSLDTQLNGLVPLSNLMTRASEPIHTMATALDTTRHDLFLYNITPTDEGELKDMLSNTETVLGDTVPYIREDVGTVTKLCDVHNELLITTEKEFAEIERTWKKLSATIKLQLQETSLYHEELQRKHDQ